MADYPIDMQLVVDPLNPSSVVRNGAVTIFDPADTSGNTPLSLRDPSGLVLANPLISNEYGFIQPFIVDIPQVLWKSGEFEGYFNSYDGLRDEAVAARIAAEAAAVNAKDAAQLVGSPGIREDDLHPGTYFILDDSPIRPDPANPGFYLIGA